MTWTGKKRGNLVIAPQQTETSTPFAVRNATDNIYLQGAATEALIISDLISATLLAGSTGSKEAFTKIAPEAVILHIASHAVFDDQSPNLSYLLLAQGERLYLEEIYGLSLPTKLVVLSACQTATSANYGRSLHAFHRAFFQAGTPSVIAGLWELPDQATSTIVEAFYRSLQEGAEKHQALRKAHLEWLATEQKVYQHPFFWAGLVVQGDATAVYSKQQRGRWWMLLPVFFLISLGIVWLRR